MHSISIYILIALIFSGCDSTSTKRAENPKPLASNEISIEEDNQNSVNQNKTTDESIEESTNDDEEETAAVSTGNPDNTKLPDPKDKKQNEGNQPELIQYAILVKANQFRNVPYKGIDFEFNINVNEVRFIKTDGSSLTSSGTGILSFEKDKLMEISFQGTDILLKDSFIAVEFTTTLKYQVKDSSGNEGNFHLFENNQSNPTPVRKEKIYLKMDDIDSDQNTLNVIAPQLSVQFCKDMRNDQLLPVLDNVNDEDLCLLHRL